MLEQQQDRETIGERNRAIARRMLRTGAITGTAFGRLTAAMSDGRDVYGYYSADGRPYVWAEGRRYTAAEWNAHAEELRAAEIAADDRLIDGAASASVAE